MVQYKMWENKCNVYSLKVTRGILLQVGISKIKKRKKNAQKIMRTRAYGRERRVNEILARLAALQHSTYS